ncbi:MULTISPECIES: phage tail tape measure protein [unclassified Agrococcus]|uniref:phage tail tape measure protein n=1 Tax=unclassified Agrococcus TaxID=2615065 RepID=UPI00361C4F0F
MATVFELQSLFTADTSQIKAAEKEIQATGKRVESKPIKVDADAKGALASMDRVEAQAKRIVSQETVAKLDANVEKAEQGIDRVEQHLEYLRALEVTTDVKTDIKKAESDLQRMERQLGALKGARAQVDVAANTSQAEADLAGVADAAGAAGDDAGDEFGESLLATMSALPVAGAVVGLLYLAGREGAKALQEGLQIEVGYDRLQALTGIDEASARRLGLVAGEAYANVFGESIEANMDTARLALQFDLVDENASVASSQRVIEGLAGIADVLGEDVQPVAAAVATLLRTGVASSADQAFDLLAAGAREGLNRNEDLLDTLTEYPALFQRLGLSGEMALGLISQGLDAGARNSDLAADALKEFQILATDGSEKSAEGFELLGLNAAEMTAQIAAGGQGAVDGLDAVLDALRDMEDPVARNAAAVALFGTQAEDLGEALFALDPTTAIDALNGVTGAAQRMFDTLSSNDATAIEQAQRNIEVAANGIKGALAQAFSEPLGDFAEWVSQNRGPLTQFLLDLANGALDFGRSTVEAAASGVEAFGEFVSGPLVDVAEGLKSLILFANPFADTSDLDSFIDGMSEFDATTQAAADTMRDELIGGLDEAQVRLNEWGEPIVQMGFLNDASLRLAGAIGEVGVAADGSQLAISSIVTSNLQATEAGQALEGQIRGAISAMYEEQQAAAATGDSQAELSARYNESRDALLLQLEAMGYTREEAQALIDTVMQTPTDAVTAYGSNAQEEQARVQALADRIVTLPDGSIVVTANTTPAQDDLNNWITHANGRRVRVIVETATPGTFQVAGTNLQLNALGGITEFMAAGGIRGSGLTPMAPLAQMVPPKTWRVVGDRSDVDELYAPLDGSPRSWALLMEGLRRMPGVMPMADGGVLASTPAAGGASVTMPLTVVEGPSVEEVAALAGSAARRNVTKALRRR